MAAALRADPATGTIFYHDTPLLRGIAEAAWRYRLGHRSALEWVLDQYKERVPKDPTIRAQFDTYRLADHLSALARLLAQVATVSVATMEIVDALAARSPLATGAPRAAPVASAPVLCVSARAPAATFSLALSREQSDFYLLHSGTERQGDALECLLNGHGHAWPVGVEWLDTTTYWQGPEGRPGSYIATMVLTPGQPLNNSFSHPDSSPRR